MSDMNSEDRSKKKKEIRLGCFAIIVICCLLATPFAMLGVARGFPVWIAFPVSLIAVTGLLIALAMVRSRDARQQWVNLIRFQLRRLESIDWRAARSAADGELMLEQQGPFTVWKEGTDQFPVDIENACDRVRSEYTSLTGLAAPSIPHLRVIAFDSSSAFSRYSGTILGNFEFSGYYLKQRVSRMVICREMAAISSAAGLAQVINHLLVYHLVLDYYGRLQTPWVQEGITNAIAMKVDVTNHPPGTTARYLRAELDRGTLFSGTELLAKQSADLIGPETRAMPSAESYSLYRRFSLQSALLHTWLAEERRREYSEFLESKRPTNIKPAAFERTFHIPIDEAMHKAIDRAAEDPLPEYVAPTEEVRSRIDTEWVPMLENEETPVTFRRILLRNFGSSGYPWRADVVMRLADDDFCEIQPDALYAIEQIAGRSFHRKRDAMHEWYNQLPQNVISPASPTRAD